MLKQNVEILLTKMALNKIQRSNLKKQKQESEKTSLAHTFTSTFEFYNYKNVKNVLSKRTSHRPIRSRRKGFLHVGITLETELRGM